MTTATQLAPSGPADPTDAWPVFIVHDLAQARVVARAAAAAGQPVVMASAPGAGGSLGPALYKEIVDQACADHPNADVIACLDCADEPGTAMNALRHGVSWISLDIGGPVRAKIEQAAESLGARVISSPADALDMAIGPTQTEIDVWLFPELGRN